MWNHAEKEMRARKNVVMIYKQISANTFNPSALAHLQSIAGQTIAKPCRHVIEVVCFVVK